MSCAFSAARGGHVHQNHGHRHGEGEEGQGDSSVRLRLAFLLSAAILLVEVVGGILSNSLALLSDAGHVLTDVIALGLAWFAAAQALRPATPQRTFGFHRAGILAALANAVTADSRFRVHHARGYTEAAGARADQQPLDAGCSHRWPGGKPLRCLRPSSRTGGEPQRSQRSPARRWGYPRLGGRHSGCYHHRADGVLSRWTQSSA